MKEIIRVERKRILNLRMFLVIAVAILIYSVCSSISSLNNYNVYDSSGNIIISSKDNLKESKLDKHNKVLNEIELKDIVDRKDTSKYLYNSNLITLVASNYEKKLEELTESDISNFYNERILNIKNNIGPSIDEEDIDRLVEKGGELNTPLEIGYAEGWKNLNNDMVDFITIIIFIIPFIILAIFGEDLKVKMKQLYTSTKHGKKTLVKARMIAGIEISSIIYGTGVSIFSLSKLLILGFNGANLPIQSSINYLFSPYNITFFEQYLINVLVGFMAMLILVSITLLITVILEQILSSAIIVTFILAIMTMLPNNSFELNHYFRNFLPYNMVNFNSYYIKPEIYNVFDEIVPTYILVGLVGCILFMIVTVFTLIISNKKLYSKLH
ncbi:MAG: hypothetical protein RR620_04180 [Clostridium sp.]